jgi:hypothetical protein
MEEDQAVGRDAAARVLAQSLLATRPPVLDEPTAGLIRISAAVPADSEREADGDPLDP